MCRYEEYSMDEYPNGTNAVVAVLAYTGAWVWGGGGPLLAVGKLPDGSAGDLIVSAHTARSSSAH